MVFHAVGRVIGTAMQKTAKVAVTRTVQHPKYEKVRRSVMMEHDDGRPNRCFPGAPLNEPVARGDRILTWFLSFAPLQYMVKTKKYLAHDPQELCTGMSIKISRCLS